MSRHPLWMLIFTLCCCLGVGLYWGPLNCWYWEYPGPASLIVRGPGVTRGAVLIFKLKVSILHWEVFKFFHLINHSNMDCLWLDGGWTFIPFITDRYFHSNLQDLLAYYFFWQLFFLTTFIAYAFTDYWLPVWLVLRVGKLRHWGRATWTRGDLRHCMWGGDLFIFVCRLKIYIKKNKLF